MNTFQAWLERHPDAAVVPTKPGQIAGGKWVQAEPAALRELLQLSDFSVAHRGTFWLLKPKAAPQPKYGGRIPVKELDLPDRSQMESEVDALLEAPEKYVIWLKEKGEWVEQGDGEMSRKTCERIVRELRREVGGVYKILPAGSTP